MARKNVLQGLMQGTTTAPAPPDRPDTPHPTRGVIGAVSRSFAELKSRAVVELDPQLIEAGGLQDRLESNTADDDVLRRSLAEYGQQVPVLVRPHPADDGRFQIVFGRRRVLAMRDLGRPVKALIRDLDDRELVLAQGQENSARRDLSFIEKVNFARQLQDHGYDRKVICDALSVDKTLISRMLNLADRLTPDLIELIGAAPSVGRDRWWALADMVHQTETDLDTLAAMVNLNASSGPSDLRFAAAWDFLSGLARRHKADAVATTARSVLASDGTLVGQARTGPAYCTVKLRADGFDIWLLDHLSQLHAEWLQQAHRPDPDDHP